MQGPFLYVGAEDDESELHRRLDGMRIELGCSWGDLADFHFKSFAGEDALIATFDRSTQLIKPTALLQSSKVFALTQPGQHGSIGLTTGPRSDARRRSPVPRSLRC